MKEKESLRFFNISETLLEYHQKKTYFWHISGPLKAIIDNSRGYLHCTVSS